ncbi:MAG: hypothetical protein U1F57_08210 [bacterium]
MRRNLGRWVLFFFIFVGVPGVLSFAHAKDKAPPAYEQGKLLDIREEKEKTTSYVTHKEGDRSVTTPQTNEQKHYFITVQSGDLVYVGEYTPIFFGKPGDWIVGDPIDVRFEGDNKMILKKPNGKELKTKIKKRIRASEYSPG